MRVDLVDDVQNVMRRGVKRPGQYEMEFRYLHASGETRRADRRRWMDEPTGSAGCRRRLADSGQQTPHPSWWWFPKITANAILSETEPD